MSIECLVELSACHIVPEPLRITSYNVCYTKLLRITEATDVANNLGISVSTAIRLIDDFVKLGIIVEITGFKRNRIFSFENYIV